MYLANWEAVFLFFDVVTMFFVGLTLPNEPRAAAT
jgi:hypothetical protein